MDSVRKPGGEMVPHRGYSYQRDLLPAERQLIETLGLSRAEYFDFLDNCYRESKERAPGYELIPDIRNEPISTSTWVVLAIGVALSAAAYLLAPKPTQQQQRDRKSIETGDVNGRQRFTPLRELQQRPGTGNAWHRHSVDLHPHGCARDGQAAVESSGVAGQQPVAAGHRPVWTGHH